MSLPKGALVASLPATFQLHPFILVHVFDPTRSEKQQIKRDSIPRGRLKNGQDDLGDNEVCGIRTGENGIPQSEEEL
jgi:hypothetical protein